MINCEPNFTKCFSPCELFYLQDSRQFSVVRCGWLTSSYSTSSKDEVLEHLLSFAAGEDIGLSYFEMALCFMLELVEFDFVRLR